MDMVRYAVPCSISWHFGDVGGGRDGVLGFFKFCLQLCRELLICCQAELGMSLSIQVLALENSKEQFQEFGEQQLQTSLTFSSCLYGMEAQLYSLQAIKSFNRLRRMSIANLIPPATHRKTARRGCAQEASIITYFVVRVGAWQRLECSGFHETVRVYVYGIAFSFA